MRSYQAAKQRENKMMIKKARKFSGVVASDSIEQIFDKIHYYLIYEIRNNKFEEPPYIEINSKNIELEEVDFLYQHPVEDDIIKKLNDKSIADIRISLTIYRIGQHSYWLAETEPVKSLLKADSPTER